MKNAFLPICFTLLVIPEIGTNNLPFIGQTLQLNSRASAQIVTDYVPPVGTQRTSRTKGAGSRGCEVSNATDLQLLTPNNHIPATISAHPTFFWSISATTLPVRFTLVEPGVVKPVLEQRFVVTRPGVVGLKLPSNIPRLVIGKEYRWTVAIVCDEERPSANTYAYSWIKRVAATPELESRLETVSNKAQERSLVYAQSGIWYDALSSSILSYEANPQDKVGLWYFLKLLAQAEIPALSNQKLQQGNIVRSY